MPLKLKCRRSSLQNIFKNYFNVSNVRTTRFLKAKTIYKISMLIKKVNVFFHSKTDDLKIQEIKL